MLWLLLAAAGMTNVGFNWAVTVGDVVRVVLLFYLMPAWTVVLAWPLLGERPTPLALVRLVLALAGVVIVLKTDSASWPVPESISDWLALAGGFSFALTNILLRKLHGVAPEARILAMFGGGALLATAAGVLGTMAGIVTAPPSPQMGVGRRGAGVEPGFPGEQHRAAIRGVAARCPRGGADHAVGGGVCQPVVRGAGRGGADGCARSRAAR